MASVLDKKAVHRDKRAQNIASMGLVRREGSRFRVTAPTSRSRRTQFEVWRDESNRVRCSCLEFQEFAGEESAFRCEHILAVKYALLTKSSETITPSLENPAPAVAASSPTQKPTDQTVAIASNGESALAAGSRQDAGSGYRGEFDSVVQGPALPEAVTGSNNDTTSDVEVAPVLALRLSHALRFSRQVPDLAQNHPASDQAGGNPVQTADPGIESLSLSHLLNRAAPGWSHAIRSIVAFGESVAVTAALTIDGVTREGLGIGAISATGIQQAEGEALKSAALKFHITEHPAPHTRITDKRTTNVANFYGDPLARSVADLVRPKQLGILRALGRELNMDVDSECQNVMRCKTDEISKRAASGLIEYLGTLRNQTQIVVRRAS